MPDQPFKSMVFLALLMCGCATPEVPLPFIKPLSESLRAELRGATVVVLDNPKGMIVQRPWMKSNAAGHGAARGAGKGLGFALGMASMSGHGALLVFPAVSVFSAPVGAIVGSSSAKAKARPDAEVLSEHARNVSHVETLKPITAVHSRLASHMSRGTPDSAMRIEISVVRFGLIGPYEVEPMLTPTLLLRARVIRASDSKVLYSNLWEVQGTARSSTEWSRRDPAEIRREFEQLSQQIGTRMFDELFVISLI